MIGCAACTTQSAAWEIFQAKKEAKKCFVASALNTLYGNIAYSWLMVEVSESALCPRNCKLS